MLKQAKTKIDTEVKKEVFIDVNGYLSDSIQDLKYVFEGLRFFIW